MNIGRSEYTRLVRQEVRLKKAEKLLEECLPEIEEYLVQMEYEQGMGRSIEKLMMEEDSCDTRLIKKIRLFLEEK